MRIERIQNSSGKEIYTLALTRSPFLAKTHQKPIITVKGKGTDLAKNTQLQKWAKRKMIAMKLVLKIIDVAKKYGDDAFKKQLWNTYHCLENVYTTKGRLHGKYCKNRFCPVCCGIRKAELIHKYQSFIEGNWKAPYFVTLTVKSPNAKRLPMIVEGMYRAFAKIIDKYHRGNKKGKCIILVGIRTFECGFNEERRTYNPHFHIIVSNKEIAEIVVKEWCKMWTSKYTHRAAQNITKVWSIKGALVELIKYCNKIFTEPDKDKKIQQKVNPKIYAAAMYNIFKVMKKHHVLDSFGFTLPKSEKEAIKTPATEYREWTFDPQSCDYINVDLDFPLIGFEKPPELEYLLENCIDTETE